MQLNKRFFSIVISLFMSVMLFCSTSLNAFATTFFTAKIQTMALTDNYKKDGYTSTNLGGISVDTANNRVFAVKSNKDEQYATLYYYSNIYDSSYKASSNRKQPKRIVFKNGLLGHANAMAIDDNYIYVTMWQKSGTEKSKILKISRKAVSELSDGTVVSSTSQKTSNGTQICNSITPITTTGSTYNRSITAISRFSYDKTNNIIKFVVGYAYDSNNSQLTYTIATYQNGKFIVSENPNDMFTVENPYNSNSVMQDIFYSPSYGLFIPIWYNVYSSGTRNTNKILVVNIESIKTNTSGSKLNFSPDKVVNVNGSTSSYNEYEVESIAFVNRDNNKNSIDPKIVFSCNTLNKSDTASDRIEMITNSSEILA